MGSLEPVSPRRRPVIRVIVGALGLALLAMAGLVVHDTWFTRVQHESLVSDKIAADRPLRVLQITDFHSLPRDWQIDQIIAQAAAARPDIVAITGDMVTTDDRDYAAVERLFAGLRATHNNIFYVWGNHDHWNASAAGSNRLAELIAEYRLVLLDDAALSLDGPWGALDVIGTDDYFSSDADLDAALAGTRPDAFRLVLTHSPDAIAHLRGSGVDLAICGHTHGGQLRLPGIGALYIPGEWWPEYSKGWYEIDGVPLYIDSGVGTTGPPIRTFNPSQLTLIEISHS